MLAEEMLYLEAHHLIVLGYCIISEITTMMIGVNFIRMILLLGYFGGRAWGKFFFFSNGNSRWGTEEEWEEEHQEELFVVCVLVWGDLL
jgi:hypothetical protein